MASDKYIEKRHEEVASIVSDNHILLVTATELETEHIHNNLKPYYKEEKIISIHKGAVTYHLGQLGKYGIIHVQCGKMGSTSRESSISTVKDAISDWGSKIVIMVGIAFGINDAEQSIGDVLVSEAICPYDNKKVGEKTTIFRGIDAPASKILLSRFRNLKPIWDFPLSESRKAQIIDAPILSGEEVIDKLERRKQLEDEFPLIKGGEMEGAGIYAACDTKANWIIVKGICDYADGNKSVDKKQRQKIAISSALSLCNELFASDTAFEELGVIPVDNKTNPIKSQQLVLFELYKRECEDYYIARAIDKTTSQYMSQFGIWISGPSGVGKSNLVQRNLILNNIEFIQVNLANCIGLNNEAFFKEILFELCSKYNVNFEVTNSDDIQSIIRKINKVISESKKDNDTVIFIDEIPLGDDSQYKSFVASLIAMLITNMFGNNSNIKFVLASINSPKQHISNQQKKITEKIKFIEVDAWDKPSILKLLDTIILNLQIQIPESSKNYLIDKANGSPRFVKNCFKNIIAIAPKDVLEFKKIIDDTELELR